MLMLPSNIPIYVASEAVDMRKGFTGLNYLIKTKDSIHCRS